MDRDVFHPDAARRLRRIAEGKGGAHWRRDWVCVQPRIDPLGPSIARTHFLPAASTVAPMWVVHRAELSTAEKFNFFLSSDSGLHKTLFTLKKMRVNMTKRAGKYDQTGG